MPAIEGEEPGDGGPEEGAFDGFGELGPGEEAVEEVLEDEVEGGVDDHPGEEEGPGGFGFHGRFLSIGSDGKGSVVGLLIRRVVPCLVENSLDDRGSDTLLEPDGIVKADRTRLSWPMRMMV